ncbi:putative ankyrin repeat protein RF_0381 [Haliotis asinina]|uniref:putative ankyrin repeat protein RF_0381 n=1 Tax=Haliotis asinina TaxID=109174 RepID=UPI003531DD9D
MMKYFLLIIITATQGKGDECPLGTYGENCDTNCSANCAPSADKKVHCHKQTGRCSEGCNKGWHGDQCNLGCSTNCHNNVCNVQTGNCIRCKAKYSGEYCETYKESDQKECPQQSAQVLCSTQLAAILVPVFIILIGIIIALIAYILWRRRNERVKRDSDDEDDRKRLTSPGRSNTDAEVSHQDSDLHDDCKKRNLEKVRDILNQSLNDIDKPGKDGMTPVMWAARRGHKEILDLLVKKGADLQLVDVVRDNILHWACRGGNISMVKHIMSVSAVDINTKGRDGRTPLMYAALNGQNKIFQLLVSKGGLPSQVENDGNSILQLACWGGNVEIDDYILSHKVDINGRGQSGRTPLTAAAYRGHLKILDLLVNKGADPTCFDDAGDNVLHSGCLGGHMDIVKRVLELDTVDINSRGHSGRTPLMMAASNGDKEIFYLLFNKNADATLVDDDGNTILHLASEGGNVNIVKYVLSLEIMDINTRNEHQETPTMMATRGSEVCYLLVERGGFIQ